MCDIAKFSDGNWYLVHSIVAVRTREGGMEEFFVKWAGNPVTKYSWVAQEDLQCPNKVDVSSVFITILFFIPLPCFDYFSNVPSLSFRSLKWDFSLRKQR